MLGNLATLEKSDVLLRVQSWSLTAQSNTPRDLIDQKLAHLQYYDVTNIDRVVSICYWGRSGSLLLASYLDGHNNIIMLPTNRGQYLYHFLQHYQSMPVWDKLLAFPLFASEFAPHVASFFEAQFALSSADYMQP